MGWYKRYGDDLYRAETTINAPGWSIGPDTLHTDSIDGWVWYDTDDEAMTATGLVATITARLDKMGPPLTPEQAANETTLRDRARTALTANGTFLALASPTNAQVLAQTKLLTRECTALIRLAVRALDATDGT